MGNMQTGYTRAQLADAIDVAHGFFHTIQPELDELLDEQPDRPRTKVLIRCIGEAHDALHAVGAGLPRVGCATADPEAQRLAQELLAKFESTGLPCGHKLGDLIGGRGAVTKCGACLLERQSAGSGVRG